MKQSNLAEANAVDLRIDAIKDTLARIGNPNSKQLVTVSVAGSAPIEISAEVMVKLLRDELVDLKIYLKVLGIKEFDCE